jgi:hypothetical protein
MLVIPFLRSMEARLWRNMTRVSKNEEKPLGHHGGSSENAG